MTTDIGQERRSQEPIPHAALTLRLTLLLVVARELVGQTVHLGRGRQHEGEAHEQGSVLGQGAVGLCQIT